MKDECKLTDKELISKIDTINGQLCKSGGKSWMLSVPPDVNRDPDLLIAELVKRFERLTNQPTGVEVWVSWDENKEGFCDIWYGDKPNLDGAQYWDGSDNCNVSVDFAQKLNVSKGQCKKFRITESVE